ncbi:MAG: heavy metal translocating P-type ATPase [Synechococcaceae cyanobacterium SM2_3_1]|nr:heavy metal translocating P-type ATPase [Synechococcaceae cyanobacterium SM2_3_1]
MKTALSFETSQGYIQLAKEHPDLIAAAVCALLVGLGALTLHLEWLALALALLFAAYGIGGFGSACEGLTTLWQERELDVDLLMIVAALGAAILGIWQQDYYLVVDGGVLILIFAISGALESYALGRTEREIRALMQLTPDQARMVYQGQEKLISISQLQVGNQILVKPGERIPTDGIICSGSSTLNQAAITGESIPVERGVGDPVFGGSLNGHGSLVLEIHQPPESSLLQRIIRLVQEAKTTAPPSQQFIERFERSYARVIVVTGVLLSCLPPWVWGWDWETTIYRALIFLVVASPCALMAAIMPTLISGIAQGARQGILFKDGGQLEQLGQVKAIAFDKTGTLTTGVLRVTQVIPAAYLSADDVLQQAAALEAHSEHPIGQAIWQAALDQGLTLPEAREVQAHAGQGIRGLLGGVMTWVGRFPTAATCPSPDLQGAPHLLQQAEHMESNGQTVVWVTQGEQILGVIGVMDSLRPEADQVIARLRQLGVEHIILLTGDQERTAKAIGAAVGVDQIYARLLPEDKVKWIQRLQQQYGTVAMVGDGINDAPALAQASVGIAMGHSGTDVALETADVVLMADQLEKLELAIQLGRRSQRIVRQNIILAMGSVALLLIANFGFQITLPMGVLGHEGSTLLVTLNGLRMLRHTPGYHPEPSLVVGELFRGK